MEKGINNLITDVEGVRVGHFTLSKNDIQTGVTVIMPGHDNMFQNKMIAASHVINGFGKTTGLIQLDELGTLESPIALTNTLSVGTVQQALVKYMLSIDETIGDTNGTVNVIVGECNDGYLNDIRQCIIQEEHVYKAIENASTHFQQGDVGAGKGMSCFQMKGGIGSASRIINIDNHKYTVGVLVLSNFGLYDDFIYKNDSLTQSTDIEKGSIIMIIATDIPMTSRQLKRVCKRMSVPLSRLGSHLGNGSGDIAIAFSTAQSIPNHSSTLLSIKAVPENHMDMIFRAAIEACEESIMNSLKHAHTVKGRNGNIRYSYHDMKK